MNLRLDRQVGVTNTESARSLLPDIAYQASVAAAFIPIFNHLHTKGESI